VNEYVVVKFNTGLQDSFSVVNPNQLGYIKSIEKSFYIGSDSIYDYFRIDKKMTYSNEVGDFALRTGSCNISNNSSFEEEMVWRRLNRLIARKIELKHGMCSVGSRSIYENEK